MATRGKKPQTKQQKQAKGETRPSRLVAVENVVEFPAVSNIPDPPAWLNEGGVRLWEEIAPQLYAQRVLTTADVHALSHLCQLHGSITYDYKRDVDVPAAKLSQLRMYFAEFGMTPSSRTRVAMAGDGKQGNKFGRNGSKAKT